MAYYGGLRDVLERDIFKGLIADGLRFLADKDGGFLRDKPEGYSAKEELKSGSLFAVHQVYRSKPLKEACFEAHRLYIDLQFLWEGSEFIAITPQQGLKRICRYNRKNDIEFFKYKRSSVLLMRPGTVAVLFPEDAHAPSLSLGKRVLVRKTVVKVKLANSKEEEYI